MHCCIYFQVAHFISSYKYLKVNTLNLMVELVLTLFDGTQNVFQRSALSYIQCKSSPSALLPTFVITSLFHNCCANILLICFYTEKKNCTVSESFLMCNVLFLYYFQSICYISSYITIHTANLLFSTLLMFYFIIIIYKYGILFKYIIVVIIFILTK